MCVALMELGAWDRMKNDCVRSVPYVMQALFLDEMA
jgi:hypothetical protein